MIPNRPEDLSSLRDPGCKQPGPPGLDEEQIALGSSAEFWEMIALRRQQRTMSRAELERRLDRPE